MPIQCLNVAHNMHGVVEQWEETLPPWVDFFHSTVDKEEGVVARLDSGVRRCPWGHGGAPRDMNGLTMK